MAYDIERDWRTWAGLRAVALVVVKEVRGRRLRSHRCGYVEVPRGHPLYGIRYNEATTVIPQEWVERQSLGKKSPVLLMTAGVGALHGETLARRPDVAFDVHGGLTFSGDGLEGYPVLSAGWWFGFDCLHWGDGYIDAVPHTISRGVVRTSEYVSGECERLAEQFERFRRFVEMRRKA